MFKVKQLKEPNTYQITVKNKPDCWICEKEIKEGENFVGWWENSILFIDSHQVCRDKETQKPESERKTCWINCP